MALTIKENNKPTIFVWGDFREKNNINRNKTKKEYVDLFDKLIDEVYLIIQSQALRQNSLEIFSKCISENTQLLWFESGKWVILFSHYFPEFEILLKDLMNHKRSTTRLHVIQSIWDNLPADNVLIELLKKGLTDSSKKVRYFSIERIQMLDRKDLLSDLEELQKTETEKENIEWLSNVISLLQKGYYTENLSEIELNIVYKANGALCTFFIDKNIAKDNTIKDQIQERISRS